MKKILILKRIGLMSLIVTIVAVGFSSSVAKATTFTAVDVAQHNTATDCWVVINNTVYNLTSFVHSHPGGSAVIVAQCGKDGTVAFNSGPHSSTTINTISSLILGTFVTTPTPSPTPTPSTNVSKDNSISSTTINNEEKESEDGEESEIKNEDSDKNEDNYDITLNDSLNFSFGNQDRSNNHRENELDD